MMIKRLMCAASGIAAIAAIVTACGYGSSTATPVSLPPTPLPATAPNTMPNTAPDTEPPIWPDTVAGKPSVPRPAGDWIAAGTEAHGQLTYDAQCKLLGPGHEHGPEILVRINSSWIWPGNPCPPGIYPGLVDEWIPGWMVSVPSGYGDSRHFVGCTNIKRLGELDVTVPAVDIGKYSVGDACPDGPAEWVN